MEHVPGDDRGASAVAAGRAISDEFDPDSLTTALAPGGLLGELRWRGLLQDVTPGLEERLRSSRPISGYNGFDPTGSSLHVGNLVPVFGLLHLQRHGGRPVVVVGGATGMVGDPSGRKAGERALLDRETIAMNGAAIRAQLERFLDFHAGPTSALMVDNHDWLGPTPLLDFLRDVGKHFTIPYMLTKDSVRQRMEGGLSFTEFSYMLLQAADFLHLYRTEGVELQTGGADQWGNITAGLELIRRVEGSGANGTDLAHGLSYPLLTNAAGDKFGKSEGGNVWLDAGRTSPFAFYQYWLDTADDDVIARLRTFTVFDEPSIARVEAAHRAAPERRIAQRVLARDVTARVHGAASADHAVRESEARFGEGGAGAEGSIVDFEVDPAVLASALEFATAVGAASSRGEARRLITQGGFTVNDERITDPGAAVPNARGGRFKVRVGKKKVLIGRLGR